MHCAILPLNLGPGPKQAIIFDQKMRGSEDQKMECAPTEHLVR
jgi:hypothetical protein